MVKVGKMTIAAYVLPTFIVILLINLYPIFYTLNLAFTNKNTFNDVSGTYHYNGLSNFQYVIQQTGGYFAASAVLVRTPLMLLFLYLQRFFKSGLTVGSVKG